jgi:hypothetical protein
MGCMKIYVDLPDELVAVWCPVEAVHIHDDIYQIVEVNSDPDDTRWPFATGAKVRCRPTLTRDEPRQTILVAYEAISN